MRGKAISKFRSPNALPRAPTPLGTEGVLRCCKCIVADFCLYATEFRVERYAELAPEFFSIYAEKLCRHSHTFTIPGQDTVCFRPLPRIYVFSYQLEMPAPSGVRLPTKSPTSTPVYPQPHRSFQPPIQPHPFFS